MRRKRNVFDMSMHIEQHIDKCEYCKNNAQYVIFGRTFFGGIFWRLLCEDCHHKWIKGELFI